MIEVVAVVDSADALVARALAALEERGAGIRFVATAEQAAYHARLHRADAVLFAVGLVDRGFVARMRLEHPAYVLIAWTPTSSSRLAAELLESGADEVVHAGMDAREIVARLVTAARQGARPDTTAIELGLLRLDPFHGEASWDGRDLALTGRERAVLAVLAAHAGRTVRRDVVYRLVWGYAMPRGERSVDVNVKRLRRKLALVAGGELQIKTQPGVGYRLELVDQPAGTPVTALS